MSSKSITQGPRSNMNQQGGVFFFSLLTWPRLALQRLQQLQDLLPGFREEFLRASSMDHQWGQRGQGSHAWVMTATA